MTVKLPEFNQNERVKWFRKTIILMRNHESVAARVWITSNDDDSNPGARHSSIGNTINNINNLLERTSPAFFKSTKGTSQQPTITTFLTTTTTTPVPTTQPTTTLAPTTRFREETTPTTEVPVTAGVTFIQPTRAPGTRRVPNRRLLPPPSTVRKVPTTLPPTTTTTDFPPETETATFRTFNDVTELFTTIESLRRRTGPAFTTTAATTTTTTTTTTQAPTTTSTSTTAGTSIRRSSSRVSSAGSRPSSRRSANANAIATLNMIRAAEVRQTSTTTKAPDRNGTQPMLPKLTESEEDFIRGSESPTSVPGVGGVDFPMLSEIPITSFDCRKTEFPGFYADLETGCQVYHSCGTRGRRHSFLCPNGTIFSQEYLICDWWYNVMCSDSPNHFLLNKEAFSPEPKKILNRQTPLPNPGVILITNPQSSNNNNDNNLLISPISSSSSSSSPSWFPLYLMTQ